MGKQHPYQGGAFAVGSVRAPWRPASDSLADLEAFRQRVHKSLVFAQQHSAHNQLHARCAAYLLGELARLETEINARQQHAAAA